MEGVKNGNIFAMKPRFKPPSKTIRSLDNSIERDDANDGAIV